MYSGAAAVVALFAVGCGPKPSGGDDETSPTSSTSSDDPTAPMGCGVWDNTHLEDNTGHETCACDDGYERCHEHLEYEDDPNLSCCPVDPTDVGTTGMTTSMSGPGSTSEYCPDTTESGGEYGRCGWFARGSYYLCTCYGAVAGLEDPAGIDPIDCPEGLVDGDPCTDRDGPVNSVGCCTHEGVLFFCDLGQIFAQNCGA